MTLFTLEQVQGATYGRTLMYGPERVFRAVSTDTRTLQPGDLYIALHGDNYNGHAFLEDARAKGAAGALIEEPVPGIPMRDVAYGGWTVLEVTDTLYALGQLAQFHRQRFRIPVVGITGSAGKTTTKEMTAAILERGRRVLKTQGNYNNEIGMPHTLLGLRHEHQAAVLEFGMRGRGQIGYLAALARPTVGVVTNIGDTHLELLGSREEIALAKAELLDNLPADGTAVLPAGDAFYPLLREHAPCRVVTVGEDDGCDVWVSKAVLGDDGCARFTLHAGAEQVAVRLGAPGRHQVWNALAAAAAALAVDATLTEVQEGLAAYAPTPGRMWLRPAPRGYRVIDDSYNANPAAMRAALECLSEIKGGRKLAILGDMKELGPTERAQHHAIGAYAVALGLDAVLAVGELAREYVTDDRATWYPDNPAALAAALAQLTPGDVVLVKASHALHFEEIVTGLLEAE